MNGKVVKITGFLLVVCLALLGYQIYRYYELPSDNSDKQVQSREDSIQKLEKEIAEKEKEKQSLEQDQAWKIEVYQTWEKEVKKVADSD